jgi:hypothetical protein
MAGNGIRPSLRIVDDAEHAASWDKLPRPDWTFQECPTCSGTGKEIFHGQERRFKSEFNKEGTYSVVGPCQSCDGHGWVKNAPTTYLPGMELIIHERCSGQGCIVCKDSGWEARFKSRSLSARERKQETRSREALLQERRTEHARIEHERQKSEQLRKILSRSNKILIDEVMKALRIDEETFHKLLWEWADALNFSVQGDYIIFNQDPIGSYLAELETYFLEWGKMDATKKIRTKFI